MIMQKGKVLALDYGSRRVGLAGGDFGLKIASPYGVVENKGFDFVAEKILRFCIGWNVGTIVVGLPVSMNGDDGNEMSRNVQHFVKRLKSVLSKAENKSLQNIEIRLFDERLSSFEADGLMANAGKSTKDKKKCRDCYAACIILQRFFDSLEK